MSFSSVSFFVFMIAVFLIYWGIPHKFRYLLLICANLCFYCSFGAKYLLVLFAEVIVAYVFAKPLDNIDLTVAEGEPGNIATGARTNSRRKMALAVAIIFTVLPLLIFKYLDFAIYSFDKVLSKISVPIEDHTLKLIAPIGISFYTFELLSYLIDVYKGKISAEKKISKLFAYASFFPNITSGPIERAGNFLPQLEIEKQFEYDKAVYGLRLVLLGMLKKTCGADVLKQYVDSVFGNIYAYRGPAFIVAIVLYTFEIYLDFSGYTDMARGFAKMLGFDLSENFKAPYLSKSVSEFWKRWHISLSQWLRDYIYIPLGGSRCTKFRKYVNLMITFFVSGLWHGASFTFIVWGILHGIYQCASDFATGLSSKLVKTVGVSKVENNRDREANGNSSTEMQNNQHRNIASIVITFVLVSFAWMFFRANSLSDSKYIAMHMVIGDNFYGQMLQMGFLKMSSYISVALILILTIVYDLISERFTTKGTDIISEFAKLKMPLRWIVYIVAGVLVVVLRSHIGAGADFIYFKF